MRQRVIELVNRFGYDLHKHVAVRRALLLKEHEVDVVLDVGAATGAYARQLRQFGYTGTILSVEPLAAPFSQLSTAAARDRHWRLVQAAVGAKSGTVTVNVAANSDSSSILPMLARHEQAAPHARYSGAELVRMVTVDDLLVDVPERRPFLKVDVQGFERQVLDGAQGVLPHLVGIQVEMSFVPLYEGAWDLYQMLEFARESGFTLMGIEPGFLDKSNGQLLQADGIFFRA